MKSHISGTLEAISLKFGMWSAEVGGSVHSKNRLVSSRQHRATEVRKLHFRSSCQYTHRCSTPASWAARHTTVCLDVYSNNYHVCGSAKNLVHLRSALYLALYILGIPKGTCRAEVMFNSEKNKPISLAVIELYLHTSNPAIVSKPGTICTC